MSGSIAYPYDSCCRAGRQVGVPYAAPNWPQTSLGTKAFTESSAGHPYHRGVATRRKAMSELPEWAMRRMDEAPDEEFYRTPRIVTHIDEGAIAAVTQLYREYFPPGGLVLDLMSSWISHLPPR